MAGVFFEEPDKVRYVFIAQMISYILYLVSSS